MLNDLLIYRHGNMIEHEQFSEFSESLVTLHVSCFATGQNDTVDHTFFIFLKMKWYLSDLPVAFNFLVIGIDSFDKKYLKKYFKTESNLIFSDCIIFPRPRCIILPQ